MAIKTTALTPFNPTAIPDRLSPLYATDKRILTTTAGTGAVVRLNRVQAASFSMQTPVNEITEMGAQNRVGGVDELGEAHFKVDFTTVSIQNLGAVTGKVIASGSGQTTTIGLTEFQNAIVDLIRLSADSQNNVFGSLYMQDAIIEDYHIDAKNNGVLMDGVQGAGPNATFFPGFVCPKVYVVQAGDITGGVCTVNMSNVLGADEAPVQIFLPSAGNPPSYWQQNGSSYFLKVEQVPGAVLTATPKRYFETGAPAATTVAYNSGTKVLTFPNGAVAAGDAIRLVFCSYNTDSFPLTVPANTPDATTSERAGITSRSLPVKINANQVKRIATASLKYSMKRERVQGVGETAIVYGPPQIPDVSVSFDMKEYDNRVLSLLSTGSPNMSDAGGGIANDFQDLNYITRAGLATPIPFSITAQDPYNVGTTLLTVSCPQLVVKDISFDSQNKSDNTMKISGMDITGVLTVAFTHP